MSRVHPDMGRATVAEVGPYNRPRSTTGLRMEDSLVRLAISSSAGS